MFRCQLKLITQLLDKHHLYFICKDLNGKFTPIFKEKRRKTIVVKALNKKLMLSGIKEWSKQNTNEPAKALVM